MKIGAMELVVIFIVALLVIGPDKLPQYARKFGMALREFRKASSGVTKEIRESVIDPLQEAQKPLREAMEPLDEISRDLKAEVKGVEKELRDIGKEKPQEKTSAQDGAPQEQAEQAAPTVEDQPAPAPETAEDKGGNT
jgi:sec-independent protein translocase protein TatB